MKKNVIALSNLGALFVLLLTFLACDKEFSNIESEIINENATHYTAAKKTFPVIAYSKKLAPVQTNNLPLNPLGVYNDPTYGLTTANIVTQITPSAFNQNFGTGIELDSVVLTIPYFSTPAENKQFRLDSIFGNQKMKLSIYESQYFLRNFDPNSNFNVSQRYYSNGSTSSTDLIDPALLEGPVIYEQPANVAFTPSNNIIKQKNAKGEVVESAPALRLKLNTNYWKQKIIDKNGQPELSNASNFYDYFRGLYFKAAPIEDNGSYMLLNLGNTAANIVIYYKKDPAKEGEAKVASTITFSFAGNKASFFNNQYKFPLADGDAVNGDEKLYLKGGEGAMAVINLFNADEEGNSAELDELKSKNWLINEANLVFYVDQEALANDNPEKNEPNRLYLYDLNRNTYLLDYAFDGNSNAYPWLSKSNHSGVLQRENNKKTGKGIKYKLRITEHIKNILKKDSTNVKLGLTVTGNISLEEKAPQQHVLTEDEKFNKLPSSSIFYPKGTILIGNNSLNAEKQLHLEIFYTEPN